MRVRIGSILHAYTGGATEVEAHGRTLHAVLADLESRFPGLRFRVVDEQDRIRPNVNFFVGADLAADLSHPVGDAETVHLLAALSGG